jgi:hypothetical protein
MEFTRMDNKAGQSSATKGSWPKSGAIEHFSYGEQVRIIMQCTLARCPYADLGAETIAAFKADWIDLLREVGTERFLAAVQRACQTTTFFPVIAEIVKHIAPAPLSTYAGPTAEDVRRKQAGERSYGAPDIRCLSKLHQNLRSKLDRSLTEDEIEGLIIALDELIDIQQAANR